MKNIKKILVFVPTYNERENVSRLCQQIMALDLKVDLLFIDDNSPDGTGEIIKDLSQKCDRVSYIFRSGKLGIGSAHQEGIAYAYEHSYDLLVTMDSDFTHSPHDIPRLVKEIELSDVSVGSRYLQAGSLSGWNPFRRFLTLLGHFLTVHLLGLPNDASGAFRCYYLKNIPEDIFKIVRSKSYSFFFESLFILRKNGISIRELPIVLSARTYGNSKMKFSDALKSFKILITLFIENIQTPERFVVAHSIVHLNTELTDPQNWDDYWNRPQSKKSFVYGFIASLYRQAIIKRNLNVAIRENFISGSRLLHAGCGSGQVDEDIQREMKITALDISPQALELYVCNNPLTEKVEHGSIFNLNYPDKHFDGIYNLGVMEHFTTEAIAKILAEFRRVLADDGKIVFFWPHRWATSVWVLKCVRWVLNLFSKEKVKFHPAEITYIGSRKEASLILASNGFKLVHYEFGFSDFWVQAVIVGEKNNFSSIGIFDS